MEKKNSILAFLIIKALIAIGFGMAFLLNPQGMLTSFSYLIGLMLLVYGVIECVNAYRSRKELAFSHLVIEDGIFNVIIGLVLLFYPDLGPNLVMIILGVWILMGGIIQLLIANRFKDQRTNRNIRGFVTVALGLLIVFNPNQSAELVSMLLGAMALIYGLYMLYLIFQFKQ